MGYFDDLNNADWEEGSAASKMVQTPPTPVLKKVKDPTTPTEMHGYMDQLRIKAYGSLDKYRKAMLANQKPVARTGGRTGGLVRGRVTPRTDYAAKFSGMNFTDEEKQYITKAGFDPANAKSVQEFILKQTGGRANLGARKGAGIADGYWGDKSVAAFEALRNQGIFNPLVDAQESVKPVNRTPVDAPNFGYKSEGNYSANQAETLKTNGITDWSSLINYAGKNKDSDFTRLLSGYFGTNDITQWNRKKLETDAKIHGTYRGQDRALLQGFLGGLLFKNNLLYYDKVADYSKKFTKPNPSGIGTLGAASETIMPNLISKESNPIYGNIT